MLVARLGSDEHQCRSVLARVGPWGGVSSASWRQRHVERFRQSLEYEHLYQRAIATAVELAEEVAAYLVLYNEIRPH